MRVLVAIVGLALTAGAGTLYAQDGLEADPGYVDLSEFDRQFGNEATFEVNIKGKLMSLVAEASREDDPELAELLHRLRAIQVRGFPMTRAQHRLMERRTEEMAGQLEDYGWDTVVRLRDYGQYVDVYVKENADFIEGLLMMVVDAEVNETVLINIVGDIEPDELGRIGSKFDISLGDDLGLGVDN